MNEKHVSRKYSFVQKKNVIDWITWNQSTDRNKHLLLYVIEVIVSRKYRSLNYRIYFNWLSLRIKSIILPNEKIIYLQEKNMAKEIFPVDQWKYLVQIINRYYHWTIFSSSS